MRSLADFDRPGVTGDTVVVRVVAGHREVLLIRRGRPPFEGSWALPGGFLDPFEPPEDAARRELAEETGLKWEGPLTILGGYGRRGRDPRGWTVSVAYLAELDDPDVEISGSDDAEDAAWWPLDEPPPLAFDHAEVLEAARGLFESRHGKGVPGPPHG